jgi:hypothetical protein
MTMRIAACAFAALVTLVGNALAQTAAPLPAAVATSEPETMAAPATTVRIPAGTIIEVELTEALSSRTSQQEQLFGLRLIRPIVIDGREVAPVGAIGGGEVIDAAHSAFGGRAGRLTISGRFIEIGGQRVRIRGMQLIAAGEDRAEQVVGVSMVPVVGMAAIFIHGGEVEIPAGSRAGARIAVDVDIPIEPVSAATVSGTAETPPGQVLGGENQQ